MHRDPDTGAGEVPRGVRPESEDSAASRRRAVELRRAAGEAQGRASALRAAAVAHGGGPASFRDQMKVWEETRRTLREMEATAREMSAERAEAEREVEEQTAWVRGQVDAMVGSGWTRQELRDIGIADEVLEQVGMLDDPRLRENRGGDRPP